MDDPGEGASGLAARGVSAGVISEVEAAVLASQRELAAAVVRVDDFDQDLGTSLLRNGAGSEAAARGSQTTPAQRAVA